jgi:hypothetical protein
LELGLRSHGPVLIVNIQTVSGHALTGKISSHRVERRVTVKAGCEEHAKRALVRLLHGRRPEIVEPDEEELDESRIDWSGKLDGKCWPGS